MKRCSCCAQEIQDQALGGAAFALEYAIGGLAVAAHTIGPDGVDPE